MVIHFPSSGSGCWLKVLLISTGVLSLAVMLKLTLPVIMEFAFSEVPWVWSLVLSWLRPPYLYLVINCIIITIVASSRFQSKVEESSSSSSPEMTVLIETAPVKVPADIRTDYAVAYGGVVLENEGADVKPEFEYGYDEEVVKVSDFDVYGREDARIFETKTAITVNALEDMSRGDEVVVSKSSWTSLNKDPTELSFPKEKPLVSARFVHRKAVKASPEGGKTLRVSRPKRHETLESTWKTITDGRPMPLTRHLRKSDTWETPPHGRHHSPEEHDRRQWMAKSETFNDRSSCNSSSSSSCSPSPGSGKLRKEPSPSQDELNRRVEAFIKKFNEDMRLQRQESLNQYMEMINRGAH